jgi:hypothetical protein
MRYVIINATAQDVETFTREVLDLIAYSPTGKIIVERENVEGDETGRRFTLYFIKRQFPVDPYSPDVHLGLAEIVEWSDKTEIKFMQVNTHRATEAEIKRRRALLDYLHNAYLEKFGPATKHRRGKRPDTEKKEQIVIDTYKAMIKERAKEHRNTLHPDKVKTSVSAPDVHARIGARVGLGVRRIEQILRAHRHTKN